MSTKARPSRSHAKKPAPLGNQQASAVTAAATAANNPEDVKLLHFIRGNTSRWISMLGGAIKSAPTQAEAQEYVALCNEFSKLIGESAPLQHLQPRTMAARA